MRYWMAVASREHVQKGVAEGIAQVCHGKAAPLKRMKPGDWIIYYSSKERFREESPCRKFTAMGEILPGEVYSFRMSEDFIPWRRDVRFLAVKEAAIEPMLNDLSFIQNKRHWGYPFRCGLFEICESDFCLIKERMEVI